jgi:hypothetical protein
VAQDFNILWIFDEDTLVHTKGFIDAMAGYANEHWEGGPTYGQINIKKGKEACKLP